MGKSNQKTVKMNKEMCNKNNLYATINISAMEKAMQNLSSDAFKLWMYFSKNQNGYTDNLSSKYCQQFTGLTTYAYNKSIKELTEKGYLVDENINPNDIANLWGFYENPDAKELIPDEEVKEMPKPLPQAAIQSETCGGIDLEILKNKKSKEEIMQYLGF